MEAQIPVTMSEEAVRITQYTYISHAAEAQFTKAKERSFGLKNFNYHLPSLRVSLNFLKERKT